MRRLIAVCCTIVLEIASGAILHGSDQHKKGSAVRVDSTKLVSGLLTTAIGLRSGIGLVHEQVTTSSPTAQAYYDQGLTLLYSYDWIEAARSFTEALRRDQRLAMAQLGLSYAFSGLNDNASSKIAEDKALSLTGYVSSREATRINLRERQLQSIAAENEGRRSDEYANEVRKALRTDPSNVQLLILAGNAAEGSPYGRGQQGSGSSLAYYQEILKLDPRNPVAHHFLTHSYEMLNDIEAAKREASMFVALAPALPHAHHMYGHELLRSGKIAEAVAEFERADALEQKSWAGSPAARIFDWHYRHNLNLLAAAYRHAGKFERAEGALRKLAGLPCRSESDEYYQAQLPAFLLEHGRYADAMTAIKDHGTPRTAVGVFFSHIVHGIASANSGNPNAASIEWSQAAESLRSLGPGWKPGLQPWIDTLQTEVELAKSQRDAAAKRLMDQIKSIRVLPGTDGWSDVVFHLEYLGKIAVSAQLWDAAQSSADRLRTLAPGCSETQQLLSIVQQHQSTPTIQIDAAKSKLP